MSADLQRQRVQRLIAIEAPERPFEIAIERVQHLLIVRGVSCRHDPDRDACRFARRRGIGGGGGRLRQHQRDRRHQKGRHFVAPLCTPQMVTPCFVLQSSMNCFAAGVLKLASADLSLMLPSALTETWMRGASSSVPRVM